MNVREVIGTDGVREAGEKIEMMSHKVAREFTDGASGRGRWRRSDLAVNRFADKLQERR